MLKFRPSEICPPPLLSLLPFPQSGSLESSNAFEELQEAMESELEAFQPGLRESKADLTDNRQSMERSLDRVLYLLVKKPEGASEHTWQMPQGGVMEEETIAKVRNYHCLVKSQEREGSCVHLVC